MSIEIRPITADEVGAFRETLSRGFGDDPLDFEGADERFAELLELDRTYVPFDGAEMVGVSAAFSFDIVLPGATTVPMGGLTMVAVKSTDRRRGLLTEMIRAHFDDCLERGEPLSGLWASESLIYGRFGYGDAAPIHDFEIDTTKLGMPAAPDPVRIVTLDEARQILPAVYEKDYHSRPGRVSRHEVWWRQSVFFDPKEWRLGASQRRYAVAFRDGEPVGYAAYRQKPEWHDMLGAGLVRVEELIGIDGDARLSLWSMLCSIDLFPRVRAGNQPTDSELVWQVANPRLIKRREYDGMYLRILDVPVALAARRYPRSDRLTIEVADPGDIAGGTFLLDGAPDGAECAPTSGAPDVVMDVRTLSTLYLGADLVGPLAAAGRISGSPEALERLAAMLRSRLAPWCPEIF